MSFHSTAIEKQFEAGQVITGLHNASVKGEIKRDTTYDELIRDVLLRADPMFWSRDTATIVFDSSRAIELSEVVINESLTKVPAAFCWFEQPFLNAGNRIDMQGESGRPITAVAWQWAWALPLDGSDDTKVREVSEEERQVLPRSLYIQAFSGSRPRPTIAILAKEGQPLFEGINENHRQLIQFVIAANAFIRQKLLVMRAKPIERHVRKRLKKEIGHHLWPDVNVIYLRASESSHPRREEIGIVEWSCRWFVRGHWRNQPYRGGVRPRYILPYLKGPSDKPIKPLGTTMYVVNR